MLSRPRTLQAQSFTLVEPQPRNGNHDDTQERQQARRPLEAEPLVHLGGEERESGTDDVTYENDAGESGSGIGLVRVDDVVQNGEDDDVDAHAEETGGDDGDDPVYAWVRCPCEPAFLESATLT